MKTGSPGESSFSLRQWVDSSQTLRVLLFFLFCSLTFFHSISLSLADEISIDRQLEKRQKEMKALKKRLLENKRRIIQVRGRRQKLKKKILSLKVRAEEFHLKIERLQIREIRDKLAIRRVQHAIDRLDTIVDADLREKGSLESVLLSRKAEQALSRMDGVDIVPESVVHSYVLSDQSQRLSSLVHGYRHKEHHLKGSRSQLKDLEKREVSLLKRQQAEESGLTTKMEHIKTEIAQLRKQEGSIHADNKSILRRRKKLMELIVRLERRRRREGRREIHRNPPVLGRSHFLWPLRGKIIEPFGTFHDGIDIAAPIGEKVRAAWSGKVLFARSYTGYGRLIILSHGNHLYTLYGHLDRLYAREGEHVPAGKVLGTVGRGGTKGKSTLFFGVTHRGHPMSPMRFLTH
uniref:Peptidase M23B n=1 Tax=Leptospirillum ferrodiazotrophum TaxID=412449 RepID=C6HV31_9BACT|nr:MAG: peptidase M23B [Leptospirillum ferrodiazotrophum]